MLRRIAVSFALTLVCVAALPAIAGAQSTIAGVVKDASGAVLPGVTVEAKSDALIEKTRAVVTNGQGQYTIVDLRPGVYGLSFTLPASARSRGTGSSCQPTSPRRSAPS